MYTEFCSSGMTYLMRKSGIKCTNSLIRICTLIKLIAEQTRSDNHVLRVNLTLTLSLREVQLLEKI